VAESYFWKATFPNYTFSEFSFSKMYHTPKIVYLGNGWIKSFSLKKSKKDNVNWLLEIKTNSECLNTYILLFIEFNCYFGASVFVFIIHYASADTKVSYFMATHYIEVNKYTDDLKNSKICKSFF